MDAADRRGDPAPPPKPSDGHAAATELERHRGELRDAALRALEESGDAVEGAPTSDSDALALHVDFLEATLEAEDPEGLRAYARWAGRSRARRKAPPSQGTKGLRILAEAVEELEIPEASRRTLGSWFGEAAETAREAAELADDEVAPDDGDVVAVGDPLPATEDLVDALVDGDHVRGQSIVERCLEDGHDLVTLADRLFQPAMETVGDAWERGDLSVADEHRATAAIQTLAVDAFTGARFDDPVDRRILVASVEGNRHDMGTDLVADAFETAGWQVRNLGADTPTTELVDETRAWEPHVVALSLSMATHVPVASDAVNRIREAAGDDPPLIMVGGQPLRDRPELGEAIGADAQAANVAQALREVD
jgi:methanogenic corrinoid protein MtbC1